MTFFLFASIAAALLVACDLVTGKITLGHLSGWPYTRRDDARSYWIVVAWRVLIGVVLVVLAIHRSRAELH
jgi:hypothetical protein